ncbi:MAG TPA: hypothetical protein PLG47_00965 [Candidatus Dojkabacteria bacterium]|jgi:hypothetical protein|nr:hypothetical protein [Candidatus Dojkabacteria bacterium]
MNEYGPVLPATGGASVFVFGVSWGIATNTIIVVLFALIGLVFMGYSLFKLLKGESQIKNSRKD